MLISKQRDRILVPESYCRDRTRRGVKSSRNLDARRGNAPRLQSYSYLENRIRWYRSDILVVAGARSTPRNGSFPESRRQKDSRCRCHSTQRPLHTKCSRDRKRRHSTERKREHGCAGGWRCWEAERDRDVSLSRHETEMERIIVAPL